MSIQEQIEQLDMEIKKLNLPFDKGLPFLRERLWAIADEHNLEGADIFMQYMDWKSKQE